MVAVRSFAVLKNTRMLCKALSSMLLVRNRNLSNASSGTSVLRQCSRTHLGARHAGFLFSSILLSLPGTVFAGLGSVAGDSDHLSRYHCESLLPLQ